MFFQGEAPLVGVGVRWSGGVLPSLMMPIIMRYNFGNAKIAVCANKRGWMAVRLKLR